MLVHVDGRVEYSGADTPEFNESSELHESRFEDQEQVFEDVSEPPSDPVDLGEVEDLEEAVLAGPTSPEPPPPNEELFEFSEPQEPAQADVVEDMFTEHPMQASDSPDLSDIAAFGNSGGAAKDGALRYNLHVSGIDTVDIRNAFREALSDRKFMWDIDEILKSVRLGEVRIQDITPVKAHILISRLRGLPVQVKWEQYAVHQV